MADIPFAQLNLLLKYEPETGRLFWLERPKSMFPDDKQARLWNAQYAGKEAFTASNYGYLRSQIGNVFCFAHRVAWTLFYQATPQGQIDHIDRDRANNRISNLRVVTNAENNRNKKMHPTSTTGINGVSFYKRSGKWRAQIAVNQVRMCLGYFDTIDEAAAAREKANHKYGFSPRHGLPD